MKLLPRKPQPSSNPDQNPDDAPPKTVMPQGEASGLTEASDAPAVVQTTPAVPVATVQPIKHARRWRIALVLLAIIMVAGGVVAVLALRKPAPKTSAKPQPVTEKPAVTPEPTPATPTPTPTPTPTAACRYGMALGGDFDTKNAAKLQSALADIKSLHGCMVRTGIRWSDIEPQKGQYNWGAFDAVVKAANQQGLQLLVNISVVATPKWANNDLGQGYPPLLGQDYLNFAKALATRYRTQGVHNWQVGNEPNLIANWKLGPNASEYAKMLKAAYLGIKTADSSATVLTAGLGSQVVKEGNIDGPTFIAQLYAAGAKPYFDVLSYHPYSWPNMGKPDGWQEMLKVRSIMVANGDSAKKIWGTEFGAPASVGEAAQAQYLTRDYAAAKKLDWAGPFFWYLYQDSASTTGENGHGLLRADGGQRPAYAAYRQAATP